MYLSYSEDEESILDMYLADSEDELIIKFCSKKVTFDLSKNQTYMLTNPITNIKQTQLVKTLKSILKQK